MILTGSQLGQELAKALGLDPKKVRSLTIRCAVNEVATVTAETFVVDEQAGQVATLLQRYVLVEKE